MPSTIASRLLTAGRSLSRAVGRLDFAKPVRHVYNPLTYASAPHRVFVERFGNTTKRVVLLGMNPGPYGMMQTGVPFGEIAAVRDWMRIDEPVKSPRSQHPKRPIEGFACRRAEVSGQRLWGLFATRFGTPEAFFEKHFVVNYCPLVFLEESGRNRTPDKLPTSEAAPLYDACDKHLRTVIRVLEPEWVVGVGAFAEKRARETLPSGKFQFGRVLHPSPASPIANRGWAEAATKQLEEQGIW